NMNLFEIENYFKTHLHEKICGKIQKNKLERT
ncbi:MAG: hypothetical protein RLZZ546_126, partial [Bacteroidota bacterium]